MCRTGFSCDGKLEGKNITASRSDILGPDLVRSSGDGVTAKLAPEVGPKESAKQNQNVVLDT